MTVSEKQTIPPDSQETEQKLGEFARRVVDGQAVSDLFGLDEESITILLQQAHSLYMEEQYEKAKVLVDGVLALDEYQPYARFMLGELHFQQGEFELALEHMEKANELDPEHRDTLIRLGELYLRVDRNAEARDVLKHYLEEYEEVEDAPKRALALGVIAESRLRKAQAS